MTSFVTFAAVAGLTMCPAWISHPQSGNLYGPLLSIVNGSYVVTSIPATVGMLVALMNNYVNNQKDSRKVCTAFLLGCLLSLLATLVTPSLGLVPEAGIFAAGYGVILALAVTHFFPFVDRHVVDCIYDDHRWAQVADEDRHSNAEPEIVWEELSGCECDEASQGLWRTIPMSE